MISAVNIPKFQLIMPSSTLHRLTGGLKYLRDILYIFKSSHLHEEHYVLSPFHILHSSIFPHFCALYVNTTFILIPLQRVSSFSPSIIFCFALFIISFINTLCIKGQFFRYMFYFPTTLLAIITILNLPFHSKHLSSHFLLFPLWIVLYVNNILFFL